MQMTLEGVSSH